MGGALKGKKNTLNLVNDVKPTVTSSWLRFLLYNLSGNHKMAEAAHLELAAPSF